MTEITLFGACVLTPKGFAVMEPHLQTEAVRLMTESGYGVAAIERIVGARRSDLLSIYNQSHHIKLRDDDRVSPPKGPRVAAMSATARLVLVQMQDQAGALASSLNSIAYDLGKSTTSVRHGLQQLVEKGLIELTVPARGTGHPAQYRLTAAGEVQAAELAKRKEVGESGVCS